MARHTHPGRTRRVFLRKALALPGAVMFGSIFAVRVPHRVALATPACADHDDRTPSETAGPFYKPNSPQRTSLRESGMHGTPLLLKGVVLSTTCTPIAHALLDFWHADAQGTYDNVGYRLRGHQFADDAGGYALETIVPGLYPGRTRHLHVRVQAPNQPLLTTQLYFPDEPRNRQDWIFNATLLVQMQDSDAGKVATFNFVLEQSSRS